MVNIEAYECIVAGRHLNLKLVLMISKHDLMLPRCDVYRVGSAGTQCLVELVVHDDVGRQAQSFRCSSVDPNSPFAGCQLGDAPE